MPQKTSPFLEGKWGWNYGESGWNTGADENWLKFSYMFDANVNAIVSTLPTAANGEAYYLTTDNRIYFVVDGTYYSTSVPKWFEFKIKSTGVVYVFDGSTVSVVLTPQDAADALEAELAASTGSSKIGAGIRTQAGKNADFISVRDYITTTIDGTVSNQTGIQDAVTAAYLSNSRLYWPAGTYVSTATITNFWEVEHFGPGVLKRGASLYKFSQYGNQTNQVFVSPGVLDGDGLASTQPFGSISDALTALGKFGKLNGRWQIIGTGGTYAEVVAIPDGLAQGANYLEFKFPSIPGVRTDPNLWPAGAAVLDVTGLNPLIAFNIGRYNKVYIEYLLVKGAFNTGLAATAQVSRAISVDKFSLLLTQGVSYVGNGLSNLNILPEGSAVVQGGWMRDSRYCIDNTGGSLSLSATDTTYTVVQGGLEYGLYQKHDSRTVMDYTEFSDCGNVAGAASYGAAIFNFRSNSSIDTRGCKFYRNNIALNIRDGSYAANPGIPDVFGTGADANGRDYLRTGYGSIDLESYQATSQLNITRGFGGGTVTGTTTALVYNSLSTLAKRRFVATDQGIQIIVYASNNAGGTAQIRPSFVTTGGVRYELGNFQIAASTSACVILDIVVSSNGTVASVYYRNIGATTGGTLTGQIIVNPVPFATEDLTFQVWGDTSSTNTLTVRRSYIRTEG